MDARPSLFRRRTNCYSFIWNGKFRSADRARLLEHAWSSLGFFFATAQGEREREKEVNIPIIRGNLSRKTRVNTRDLGFLIAGKVCGRLRSFSTRYFDFDAVYSLAVSITVVP